MRVEKIEDLHPDMVVQVLDNSYSCSFSEVIIFNAFTYLILCAVTNIFGEILNFQ